MKILGISAFYHDSAAVLVVDGEIIAAAQEERFTRKKHDQNFPVNAVYYCLKEGGLAEKGVDSVVFYDKPVTKFSRILKTYFSMAPAGLPSFLSAVPVWAAGKLWTGYEIERTLNRLGVPGPKEVLFAEHHVSHAASAFYPSPFEHAAILTVDGVGEWATASIGKGAGSSVEILKEMPFPHSLGLLYSAFTYFCGFRVNFGEYKLMGLAPYGEPAYADLIKKELIDIKEDGSVWLNQKYFNYLGGLTMTNRRFAKLFGGPPRKPETEITKREMDMASSIQVITGEIILKMARCAKVLTGEKNLCLAGGVALNCVANGLLLREKIFDRLWIQPAAGDAGAALGCALYAAFARGEKRTCVPEDSMKGSRLGPGFSDADIEAYLRKNGYPCHLLPEKEWAPRIADLAAKQKVIGLVNGRMEFGPRALGGRSVIGDARSPKMQSLMNLKIKYRESFRPFAPSVLAEDAGKYFDLDAESPYMLLVAPVKGSIRRHAGTQHPQTLREWVNETRSEIPAVTHVDYSARIQTVDPVRDKKFYGIINEFKKLTGCSVIINTSFNVRGEPIVCSPEDAYTCFMRTEMDCLVLGSFLLLKEEQPAWQEDKKWREEFILD